MKGYKKCGAYVGFLSRYSYFTNIPKECLKCPKAYLCALDLNSY